MLPNATCRCAWRARHSQPVGLRVEMPGQVGPVAGQPVQQKS